MSFEKIHVLAAAAVGVGLAVAATVLLVRRKRQKARTLVKAAKVKSILLHPVKSCKGVLLDRAYVTKSGGLQDIATGVVDRSYMLRDDEGSFVTSLKEPRLVLVEPALHEDHMTLTARDMPDFLTIPYVLDPENSPTVTVRVWGRHTEARDCGDEAAAWFQQFLGRADVRLVSCPAPLITWKPATDKLARKLNLPFGKEKVAFQDLSPINILSEQSVADINTKVDHQLTFENFRTNIHVDGCFSPFEEDTWQEIKIGGAELRFAKLCTRCKRTTIHLDKGTFDVGNQPLKAFESYRDRKYWGGLCFSIDAAITAEGIVSVGDDVMVTYQQ